MTVRDLRRGVEVGFHGVYRDIDPPQRLVSTEAYEGIPDPEENASLNTVTLDEADGVTTMTVLVEHATKKARPLISGVKT